MSTHYYLTIFPHEALIASQLAPDAFGSYMAIGSKHGSYERLIFIEVEEGFGSVFDWDYAREQCVAHPNGDPKHSVWMSTYRVLEHTPVDKMKNLFLVTGDGRTLEITKSDYTHSESEREYHVYLELCPLHPLVTSRLSARDFAGYMTDPENKVMVPKVAFADLKVIDFRNPEDTGNIGRIYDRNIEHLKECIAAVTDARNKVNKNVERSVVETFGYGTVQKGFYIGDKKELVFYPMPNTDTLRQKHYDWARSAQIL